MDHFFYHTAPETCVFPEDESKHIVRVLRMQAGDGFVITDGKGRAYDCSLLEPHPKRARFEIRNWNASDKPSHLFHLAIAPTKNMDRMEWLVEKCTEMGIASIRLFVSQNSERQKIRTDKLQARAIGAMKQSKQVWLPDVLEPVSLDTIITSTKGYIAHCREELPRTNLRQAYESEENPVLLIGPEGDFTQEEIELATESGWKGISLGNDRLRTETAGVYACAAFKFFHS